MKKNKNNIIDFNKRLNFNKSVNDLKESIWNNRAVYKHSLFDNFFLAEEFNWNLIWQPVFNWELELKKAEGLLRVKKNGAHFPLESAFKLVNEKKKEDDLNFFIIKKGLNDIENILCRQGNDKKIEFTLNIHGTTLINWAIDKKGEFDIEAPARKLVNILKQFAPCAYNSDNISFGLEILEKPLSFDFFAISEEEAEDLLCLIANEIRENKIKIFIDDFGILSSNVFRAVMPSDGIKIDGSIVQRLKNENEIIRKTAENSIMSIVKEVMKSSQEKDIIFEYVSDEFIFNKLREIILSTRFNRKALNRIFFQGFYLGKPDTLQKIIEI